MNAKEIRWKQRFQNFEKAFGQLTLAVKKANLNDLEKQGLIQIFEHTFELAWKTLKDYLESKDITHEFARDVIRSAFKTGLIEEGDLWIAILEDRILMSHTYNEENFNKALNHIYQKYYAAIDKLLQLLKTKL